MADQNPGGDAWVAALKRERAGYLADGRPERAAQVEEELAKLGHGGVKPQGRVPREGRQVTADAPVKAAAAKPKDVEKP